MKRHPILFSILVIILIVAVMSAAIVGIFYFLSFKGPILTFGQRIALIEIKGVLDDASDVTDLLHRYGRQKNIKAVIIKIDSPGGGVAPAQEIYREIEKVRRKKPVVAYMGNIAASGGYYVACAADKVVANPGTLTGSIGVIMQFTNWEKLLKKLGIDLFVIKAGRYKDIGSPARKMTPAEEELLNQVVKNVHERFIRDVARGRKLALEKVREIADGRIFTGQQAKELGLVDKLGNFHDALDLARELAHIKGEVSLVRPRERGPSLWEYLLRSALKGLLEELEARRVSLEALLHQVGGES